MPTTEVAVIGGGIAGLTAAIEAARAGCSVDLYEASEALGGRARTRHVKGFAFNQGPHALYRGGILRLALDRFGVRYRGKPAPLKAGLAITDAGLPLLPFSATAIARTGLLAPAEKAELANAFGALFGGAPPGAADTLDAYFERLGLSDPVRAVLEALVRVSTYCHAPRTMLAADALEQVRLGSGGVIYLHGGWTTLIDGLIACARALGVALHSATAVEEVAAGPKAVSLQLADGTTRQAATAILAVSPDQARDLAPGVASLRQAAERARPVRMACLDLALEHLPVRRRVYALGVDQPLYYSVHSAAARLAPPGAAMIHAARYLAPGETPDRSVIASLERLMDRLQPDWRPLEVARQTLPAITVAHDYPQAAHGGLAGRPGVRPADGGRVLIAGDWVGPQGLLSDAAAASGLAAATAAVALVRGEVTGP